MICLSSFLSSIKSTKVFENLFFCLSQGVSREANQEEVSFDEIFAHVSPKGFLGIWLRVVLFLCPVNALAKVLKTRTLWLGSAEIDDMVKNDFSLFGAREKRK